jgi:hypothetical protein
MRYSGESQLQEARAGGMSTNRPSGADGRAELLHRGPGTLASEGHTRNLLDYTFNLDDARSSEHTGGASP